MTETHPDPGGSSDPKADEVLVRGVDRLVGAVARARRGAVVQGSLLAGLLAVEVAALVAGHGSRSSGVAWLVGVAVVTASVAFLLGEQARAHAPDGGRLVRQLDDGFKLEGALVAANDVARTRARTDLAHLVLDRGAAGFAALGRSSRGPALLPRVFQRGLDLVLLMGILPLLLSDPWSQPVVVPRVIESEAPSIGGGGGGVSRPGDDVVEEGGEEDDPSPGDEAPSEDSRVPDLDTVPRFSNPLRRPGPETVKDALVLEDILAREGRGGEGGARETGSGADDPPPPEDLDAVFERMREMDTGKRLLDRKELDLVARYFAALRTKPDGPDRGDRPPR